MRADSAEDTSRPTTVLALVKAPLASLALVLLGGSGPGETGTPAPVDTLVLIALLAEEVLFVFLEPMEEVVMVVFPAVGGNLALELSVVSLLEAISSKASYGTGNGRDRIIN